MLGIFLGLDGEKFTDAQRYCELSKFGNLRNCGGGELSLLDLNVLSRPKSTPQGHL